MKPKEEWLDVIVSSKSRTKLYHKRECYRVGRMKGVNKLGITLATALKRGCRPCPYCRGLAGELKYNTKVKEYEVQYEIITSYDKEKNIYYIRTKGGYWKVVEEPENGTLLLYHANRFSVTKCDTELRLAEYHRQDNVDEFKSLHQIINYVYFHDLRKMEKLGSDPEGYKELPRSTKKQKKKYKHKKHVATMGNINWVNSILDGLEADNPDMKGLSVW